MARHLAYWSLVFIITVLNSNIHPSCCINWSEIRKQREQDIIVLGPIAMGINNVNNDNYRFSNFLPNVNLYYMNKEQKIHIKDTIDISTKLSMENDLDEELGPQSLTEIVAIARLMLAGQQVINASLDISEVDIRDVLNSEIRLYVEDAVEIFKEILYYYAPQNLNPDELKLMATPKDSTVNPSQGQPLTTDAPVMNNETLSRHSRVKRKIIDSSWDTCVYYTISDTFSNTQRKKILSALTHWESETCFTFKRRYSQWLTSGMNFVPMVSTSSCGRSSVGKKDSGNRIQLSTSCFKVGTVIHEIGHALGFWHEHQRPDRDEYVTVDESVSGDVNYQRKTWGSVYAHGIPYDYSSIMHYNDGTNKMTLKDETMTYTVGQRAGLSFRDSKLANFHLCEDACRDSLEWSSCLHRGYRDPKSCTTCRCPTGWRGTRCQTRDNDVVCGSSSLTAYSYVQTLKSPSVTGEVDCAWLITAPSSRTVYLQFTGTFKMRSANACDNDYVEIRWKNIDQIGARRCGYSRPTEIYESATHAMMVVFHSDNLLSQYKFSLNYWTGSCGSCSLQYSPEKACNSQQSETCSVSYTTSCSWWRRCTRTRSHTCYKLSPYCCHGELDNGQCDVGCGGCSNIYVKNQPSCQIRHTKMESYTHTTTCRWWRRCSHTRYREVYSHTTNECCANFQLSGDQTRCLKP